MKLYIHSFTLYYIHVNAVDSKLMCFSMLEFVFDWNKMDHDFISLEPRFLGRGKIAWYTPAGAYA